MVIPHVAVHRCLDEQIYKAASRGEIQLWYSSESQSPLGNVGPTEFAGEFRVPAHQALSLYERIREGQRPYKIVSELGLSRSEQWLDDYSRIARQGVLPNHSGLSVSFSRDKGSGGDSLVYAVIASNFSGGDCGGGDGGCGGGD